MDPEVTVEIPEEPPRLPMPGIRDPILMTVVNLMMAALSYGSELRFQVFAGGIFLSLAVARVMDYIRARHETRHLQANMDETYAEILIRAKMIPKLVERHGPEATMEMLTFAEKMVSEGDFDSIFDAVASIERHHDMEPTVYD